MEGGTTTSIQNVVTAIEGMATTVATNALGMVQNMLPILAPVTAAVIIAGLGRKLILRFAR